MNDDEHSEKAFPGNANLPIGVIKIANREIGVPGVGGWHSRGYLPHFDGAETVQHVTVHFHVFFQPLSGWLMGSAFDEKTPLRLTH